MFNVEVQKICIEENRITKVIARAGEEELEIECEYLVESIPIVNFVNLLDTTLPPEVPPALKNLRYRHQVYLFITLNKESVTRDQWIYFPKKEVPVARMSEMKNFSSWMSPSGTTSLFLEFFCFEDEPVWSMNKDELFAYILPHLEKAGFLKKEEVRTYYRITQKDVYPIYDLHYESNLGHIKGFLDRFSNLFYIGRPGRFRYNNQDHSLEMGIAAAESIITGKKADFDAIGGEKEYYEKGDLKDKVTTTN